MKLAVVLPTRFAARRQLASKNRDRSFVAPTRRLRQLQKSSLREDTSYRRTLHTSTPTRASPTNMNAAIIDDLNILKGEKFDMKAGRGNQVFVLEFWATWCPPCVQSIPHVTQLAHKYKSQGAVFVGITNEDNTTAVKQFINKMGPKMDYTVAQDTTGSATQSYMEKYGVQGIPHAFVIDKAGKVAYHGHPMEPAFESAIQKAVSQPAPEPARPIPDVTGMSHEDIAKLSVADIKAVLKKHNVDFRDCVEKSELVSRVEVAILKR